MPLRHLASPAVWSLRVCQHFDIDYGEFKKYLGRQISASRRGTMLRARPRLVWWGPVWVIISQPSNVNPSIYRQTTQLHLKFSRRVLQSFKIQFLLS